MHTSSDLVKKFFEENEKNSNSLNLEGIAKQYSDVFMFADSSGARPVKKEDLLKALPARKEFVDKIGLKYTKTVALKETQLDDHYIMVEAEMIMHFEQGTKIIDDKDSTMFILYKQNDSLKIVFHLEHRNLMEKLKEHGLV